MNIYSYIGKKNPGEIKRREMLKQMGRYVVKGLNLTLAREGNVSHAYK